MFLSYIDVFLSLFFCFLKKMSLGEENKREREGKRKGRKEGREEGKKGGEEGRKERKEEAGKRKKPDTKDHTLCVSFT